MLTFEEYLQESLVSYVVTALNGKGKPIELASPEKAAILYLELVHDVDEEDLDDSEIDKVMKDLKAGKTVKSKNYSVARIKN